MDSNSNFSPTGDHYPDFGLFFNDIKFSDRVLRLEIVEDTPLDFQPESDKAERKTKRSRVNGDVNAASRVSKRSGDGSTVPRVKILHVNSVILAQKSPFFYKLFSNGMMESEQKQVIIRISASEEVAVMELLKFMYSTKLTSNTPSALFDVLMVADKYEVASCTRSCCHVLKNLPMTLESALMYLDLSSDGGMADVIQPLTDVAKQYVVARYKDISKCDQDEVINLPLSGIKVILSSDELQVSIEDVVYDFAVKWARTQYQDLDERRNILSSHLGPHIRFPHMSFGKLKEILTCNDFDREFLRTSVLEAMFFKSDATHRRQILAAEDPTKNRQFIERAYRVRPLKVVELELPGQQQCGVVVYFDLKREECLNLYPSGRICSEDFHLGGHGFFIYADCKMEQNSFHVFNLYIGMHENGPLVDMAVDYELSTKWKSSTQYVRTGNWNSSGGRMIRNPKMIASHPWTILASENCAYFINGTLQFRIEITLKDNSNLNRASL